MCDINKKTTRILPIGYGGLYPITVHLGTDAIIPAQWVLPLRAELCRGLEVSIWKVAPYRS